MSKKTSKKTTKKKADKPGFEYPENKTLKKLQRKGNQQYKEMCRAIEDAEDAHQRFYKTSKAFAGTLKEIEAEALMPNFGER